MPLCTDTDLLHWEPNVLSDAAFASQTLISGSGNLAGTGFTIAAGSLADTHVEAGQVIIFSGAASGCYPIVSVDSDTQLTVSVLYNGLDEGGEASAVPASGSLTYAIRTFSAQARIVSDVIQQAAGLDSGEAAAAAIVNPQALKRACALGVLQLIYSALAAASDAPANLSARADLYEKLYRRAMRSVKVELDLDGDGAADTVRALNVLELARV